MSPAKHSSSEPSRSPAKAAALIVACNPAFEANGSAQKQATDRIATPFSPRQAMWLLVRSDDQLDHRQVFWRETLLRHNPQAARAYPLAQQFVQMVQQRQAETLDTWLLDALSSEVPQLVHFARGLQQDYAAVKAALELPWISGQTEGQITRLKLIKRQMYGRANFDLLRLRVLHPP